jgi:sRNA-binding protein
LSSPERLGHAVSRRLRVRRAALAWLRTAWPVLFCKPPRPLAVGLGQEIVARGLKAGIKPHAIGAALRHWTNSRGYLESLAAAGAVRWGLDGAAVDFVASEHQADARERLAALAAAKAARRRPSKEKDA